MKTAAATSDAPHTRIADAGPNPESRRLARLLMPTAPDQLEAMAETARTLTQRHFGRTISLYVPLYLSNHCDGGCAYCGYASDRDQPRARLEQADLKLELTALKDQGFEDVLLLTGERSDQADFNYLLDSVASAAAVFHTVTIESFAMTTAEYRQLVDAGCTGITLYQETYDRDVYAVLHRWGAKRDFDFRLEAPARALDAGMRTAGLGVLLGLADPMDDLVSLFEHVRRLRKDYWQAGTALSFPRICSQRGEFVPDHVITDEFLAQAILAFRICMPDMPLVLSTRESASFRDGMAGLGISRMSVGSQTTVGGYAAPAQTPNGQFTVSDDRDVATFCRAIRNKGLEPVFKNWESVFSGA